MNEMHMQRKQRPQYIVHAVFVVSDSPYDYSLLTTQVYCFQIH